MYIAGPDGPLREPLPDPIPGAPIALTEEGQAFWERMERVRRAQAEAAGLMAELTEEPMSGHRRFS